MNDRDRRIMQLEDEITDLRVRRDERTTTDTEKQSIDARLALLESELAQLRA